MSKYKGTKTEKKIIDYNKTNKPLAKRLRVCLLREVIN